MAVHFVKNRLRFLALGLLAVACSSSPGSNTTGTAGQGQAGASAGSSGGTSNAGTGGTQSAAGSGGDAAGTDGKGGAGGSVSAGSGGNGGGAGTTGQAGTGGSTAGRGGASGGAGGRGGAAGTASGGARCGGQRRFGRPWRRRRHRHGGRDGNRRGVANPVTPTKNGNRYRFAWGDVVLEVDAAAGARVATLSLGGADLIVPVPAANDPTTYGSVFWTSPRSAWTPQTWPPPVMIDSAMYTTAISGTHVVATGPADTSIGVSMAKDYSADATSGWIKIVYTINATKAQKAAPWEVSRVPRGGIVFFPLGLVDHGWTADHHPAEHDAEDRLVRRRREDRDQPEWRQAVR